MNVLIIGYGSIGKRHYEILSLLKNVITVDIVTKQNIDNIPSFKYIEDIQDLNYYDYFVIASETINHFNQLNYICSKVYHKKILVEKPLYDKSNEIIKTNNKIFTAYNLRFHPIFDEIKKVIKDEDIYYVNIICGQYLPTWRPEQDYQTSYSADLKLGGGVLRDLSHELDYANWLFGSIKDIQYINTKISDLKINSDDILTFIGLTNNKTIINLTVDYISKKPIRRLLIHTNNKTIEVDIVKNLIDITDKLGKNKTIKLKEVDRNYTYKKMHESVLKNKFKKICSFTQGLETVKLIEKIKYKEL